jgi:hemerythrin-like domain-containing protein
LTPPDLVAFEVLHRGMRADSARLAKAVAEVDEAERSPRARQLHRWFDGFAGELRAYHTVEDDLFFPVLAERVSVFEYEVGRIEAEHAHLDAALDRTRRALETLGDAEVRWADASRRATTTTTDLHDLLDRQLAFEADFVLPMFVRHLTADDYAAIDVMAARNQSFGQLPFTIPWAMANADPCEQRSLLDGAPLSFRLLWWATRGRYRRLVDEAFGHGNGHVNGNGHGNGHANGNGHSPAAPGRKE